MIKQQRHYQPHGQRLNWQRGVSLVPVVVSIAIFTTLAVEYSLPRQQQQLREMYVTSAQTAATQILQAALNYRINNRKWPVGTDDLAAYLSIINNNPWGYGWQFFAPANSSGLVLATQAGDSHAALSLAARFGAIARVCSHGDDLCNDQQNNGTWVYISIAPP